MTPLQTQLYQNALSKNRTVIEEAKNEDEQEDSRPNSRTKKQPKTALQKKDDTTNNVLMDLRKAASHPLLFRTHYDDTKLKQLAKACLKEPEFSESDLNRVIEDMEVRLSATIMR
jgi:SWI/SNF-related matrix-associated actin-dependent regulator 1 of chromatin subfamily A